MEFFSEKHLEAIRTGKYVCDKCGSPMVFEDEWEETLICTNPECGYVVDVDMYGRNPDENLYPTKEEVTGEYPDEVDDENLYGETYDEVYDELDQD